MAPPAAGGVARLRINWEARRIPNLSTDTIARLNQALINYVGVRVSNSPPGRHQKLNRSAPVQFPAPSVGLCTLDGDA